MAQAQGPSPSDLAASTGLLVAANSRATSALRDGTLGMLSRLWRSLGTWHRSDFQRFLPQAEMVLDQAQEHMAGLTASYLSRYAELRGGHLPDATPPVDLGALRNGLDRTTELERPFVTVWTALKDGKPLQTAVEQGEKRLESLAATDLQLAKTNTAQSILSAGSGKIVGYRRVLEGASSCGLCIVASTQRYHKADLLPIHPGCDCDVEPIWGNEDPGRLLNAGTLADVHAAVQATFGSDSSAARAIPGAYQNGKPLNYRDLVIVHRDGEIGPVLGVKGQKFTGPADLKTTAPTGG